MPRIPHRQLAECRSLLASNPEKALSHVKDLLVAYPDGPDVLALAAECSLAVGDRSSAMQYAAQALQIRPGHGNANLVMGRIAAKHGQLRDAVKYYRRALRSSGSRVAAHKCISSVLFEMDEHTDAIKHLKAYLRVNPDDFDAWMMLGWQLYYVGRWEECDAAYARAMTIRPESGRPYVGQGLSRHMRGMYADAMAKYREAIEIDPGYAKAYERMGLLRHVLNDYVGAVHCMLYSLRLDAGNPRNWHSLLYVLSGRMNRMLFPDSESPKLGGLVREMSESAIAHVSGESPGALLLLYEAYDRLGNADECVSAARRYLQLYPDNEMAGLMQMRVERPSDLSEDEVTEDDDNEPVQEFLCAFGHLMPGSPAEKDEIAEIRRLWSLFLDEGLPRPDI